MSDPRADSHDDRPTVVGTDPDLALGDEQTPEEDEEDEEDDGQHEEDVIDVEDLP